MLVDVTSSFFTAAHTERVAVLDVDPELGQRLRGARLERAHQLSVARVLRRDAGLWEAKKDAAHGRDGLGLLVVEGVLVRRVGLEGRFGAELLSVGDLLQPAEHDGEEATLPFEATWRVLSGLRLAVLDLDWMARMAPFPEVTAEITRRVMVRSRRLASMLAIAQHHRLEDRLRLFFWELADRYGRVGTDGVRLELTLTHELIGHLVGAHRPSISAALARLEQGGYITRRGRSWLLLGAAPGLRELIDEHARATTSLM
jgi:CRP-like cAMP-binding protein